jgi:hypothetical protein
MSNSPMSSDIHVYLEDGVYQMHAPLVLGPEDSGCNSFNVRWHNKSGGLHPGDRRKRKRGKEQGQ